VFRAAERKSDVEIVSKPEVLVMNQGTATIQAGGEVPYQSLAYDAKGIAQLGIEFQPVGANLTIVPTILSNNMIQLHLQQLDVSEVARIDNLRGIDLPVFSKRSQTGFVTVPNGQTLVIGGLNSRVVRKSERHLPVIGAVPILGIPFRARKSEVTFSHLLIFVTPTVVDLRDMGDDARSALEFWRTRSGDYQFADRIDQEVAVMQDE
jgi:type II secretory pathway component GspD/PulD (secretin)